MHAGSQVHSVPVAPLCPSHPCCFPQASPGQGLLMPIKVSHFAHMCSSFFSCFLLVLCSWLLVFSFLFLSCSPSTPPLTGLVYSAGQVQSGPFSLCSGLFQPPLAVLSLISIYNTPPPYLGAAMSSFLSTLHLLRELAALPKGGPGR